MYFDVWLLIAVKKSLSRKLLINAKTGSFSVPFSITMWVHAWFSLKFQIIKPTAEKPDFTSLFLPEI